MKTLMAAVAFLTRIPVPGQAAIGGTDLGRAMAWFPLVGAAIGLGGVGIAAALAGRMPSLLTAVLVVAFEVTVTGAMHLDGLADTLDGLGAGRTREDALRIMRDPRLGTFGVVGVALAVLIKVAANASLIDFAQGARSRLTLLAVAPMLARWCPVVLAPVYRSARAEGLGHLIATNTLWRHAAGGTLLTAALAFWLGRTAALMAWAVCAGAAFLVAAAGQRKLGGISGDVYGAAIEAGEVAALTLLVVLRAQVA